MGKFFYFKTILSGTNLSFNLTKNGSHSQMVSLFSFNLNKAKLNMRITAELLWSSTQKLVSLKSCAFLPVQQASGKSVFAAVLPQQPMQLKLLYPELPCLLLILSSLLPLPAALQHFQDLGVLLLVRVFWKLLRPVCVLWSIMSL